MQNRSNYSLGPRVSKALEHVSKASGEFSDRFCMTFPDSHMWIPESNVRNITFWDPTQKPFALIETSDG